MPTIDLVVDGKTFSSVMAGMDQAGKALETAFERSLIEVPPLLLKTLNTVAGQLAKKHGKAWNGSVFNSGNSLQRRTGGGLQSIYNSIKLLENGGDIVSAKISAGSLSFHEEGGTIRASGSGYLTIPLPAAMDARGVPLFQRARMWDNTFVRRSKKGNLLIFRKLPGANQLTPLYILKKQVYIRPRLGMEDAMMLEFGYFNDRLLEKISNTLDRYM